MSGHSASTHEECITSPQVLGWLLDRWRRGREEILRRQGSLHPPVTEEHKDSSVKCGYGVRGLMLNFDSSSTLLFDKAKRIPIQRFSLSRLHQIWEATSTKFEICLIEINQYV